MRNPSRDPISSYYRRSLFCPFRLSSVRGKRIEKLVDKLVVECDGKPIEVIVFASDMGEMIAKIATDDHSLGVGAEYVLIRSIFPGYEIEKQALSVITINGVPTRCDVLTLHNETDTMEVFFDISDFRYGTRGIKSTFGKTVILWLLGIFFVLLLLSLLGGLVRVLLGTASLL